MKIKIAVASFLLLSGFLALLVIAIRQGLRQSGEIPAAAPSSTTDTLATTSPTPDRRSEMLAEMHRIEQEYNRLAQTVQPQIVETPSSGHQTTSETFDLFASPLLPAWDDLVSRVQALNEEYFSLFSREFEHPTIPLPLRQPSTDAEVDSLLSDAGAEYGRWLEQELSTGSFLSLLFDPYERRPQVILVGDSYIRERLHWQALMDFRLALTAPPPDQRQQEIQAIQVLFPGEVELLDVGELLPPYTPDELHEYRAGAWRVIVQPSTLGIMLIDAANPSGGPRDHDTPACPRLTAEELHEQAIAFIQRAAPRIDVATLTSALNQKGDNFFFRWEDRNRPLLPDGRSFPFVQVAIDACGTLLNYYNTL
jgi:hypothetical protein